VLGDALGPTLRATLGPAGRAWGRHWAGTFTRGWVLHSVLPLALCETREELGDAVAATERRRGATLGDSLGVELGQH
jgi:hypothetical protein